MFYSLWAFYRPWVWVHICGLYRQFHSRFWICDTSRFTLFWGKGNTYFHSLIFLIIPHNSRSIVSSEKFQGSVLLSLGTFLGPKSFLSLLHWQKPSQNLGHCMRGDTQHLLLGILIFMWCTKSSLRKEQGWVQDMRKGQHCKITTCCWLLLANSKCPPPNQNMHPPQPWRQENRQTPGKKTKNQGRCITFLPPDSSEGALAREREGQDSKGRREIHLVEISLCFYFWALGGVSPDLVVLLLLSVRGDGRKARTYRLFFTDLVIFFPISTLSGFTVLKTGNCSLPRSANVSLTGCLKPKVTRCATV